MKKLIAMILTASMVLGLTACAAAPAAAPAPAETKEEAAEPAEEPAAEEETEVEEPAAEAPSAEEETEAEETAAEESAAGEEDVVRPAEIQVFIAASLSTVMDVIAQNFNEKYPDIKVVYNADSSGKLLTQIEEGYACDVFFSAAQKQMNTLEQDDGLVAEGTRHNVVNNQVVVVTLKDSGTAVTGLADIGKAESIALADGSVPVGRYSRVAMMNLGLLPETEDASAYTTQEVSEALGGVEISEQSNVSKVLAAVVEGSCEVGTTYYSDTYGYEDKLDILEKVSYDLTGNVIYPIAQVVNEEADENEVKAAKLFVDYCVSDEAKAVFDSYYFDTNVE